MKNIFLLLFTYIFFYSVSHGQGTVRGKIVDDNGEPVVGASVFLKLQPTVGTMTDLDGTFSLKISSTTPQVIVVSFISYQKVEETVNPKNGEVVIKNFNLVPVTVELQSAVVVGKAVKSKEVYMEKIKAKSVLSLDYISSEVIKKTGDVNVSSAVARITGVSTNGSFITVRGIGDRYMKTAINGLRIPTLDPFTNNIKLDLFPASLVDNIIITKTASPDLPGDWAGAYLSIETKDYPEKLSVNVESSFGYNQQSSLQDVVSSERSSTDWLGYDNGMRDINHAEYVQVLKDLSGNSTATTYDEFIALKPDLEDYYKNLGVTKDNWENNEVTYTKLGLVQLGLLDANQINNNAAYSKALTYYNNNYKSRADFLANAPGVISQSKLFPNNWNTITRKAPLNYSQSFSIGDQKSLFGKPLGYLVGFRYSSSIQYDPNFIGHNYPVEGGSWISNYNSFDTLALKTSKETNSWSALMNLAWKFNPDHSISFLFMPNMIGINSIRNGLNYNNHSNTSTSVGITSPLEDQFYESRKQMVYQVKSENYFPGIKLKVDLNASYTNGRSTAPDFKHVEVGPGKYDRFFRYLSQNLFDSHLSAEFPVGLFGASGKGKIKFGADYQNEKRHSDQYDYIFVPDKVNPFNFIVDSTLRCYYVNFGYPTDHTLGHSLVKAGFIMIDFPITKIIRVSGGVRAEKADIFTDVTLFDELHIGANDPRRLLGTTDFIPPSKPASLNELSILPSVNLIFKLKQEESSPMNFRLNYSKTVARPNMREISNIVMYDYEFKGTVAGNDSLKIVEINNFDARFETYFESGDNISVSAFYKNFKNHIELVQISRNPNAIDFIWRASPFNSWIKGIEIEGKKNILKQLELRANITLVSSFSKLRLVKSDYTYYYLSHPMYGQAPYVLNGIVTYTSEKLKLTAALSYNVQGPRLVISGVPNTNIPDIYEMPRNVLDFKVSKNLGKYFSLSLKVNDILNSPVRRSYKFSATDTKDNNEGYLLDYDKYTWGTTYVVAVSYKL